MRLSAPGAGIEVQGSSLPGVPGIVIGRTNEVSWGVTNTGVDVQDVYVMREVNSSFFLYDGVFTPYTTHKETILVKGGPSLTLSIRSSPHHGVVISDCSEIVGDEISTSGIALSLRWAATDSTRIVDSTFGAFYRLQRARGWEDFKTALSLWVTPSQNVVYGDRLGGFGYQMTGYTPTRDLSLNHSGAWPAPGDDSSYTWGDPWPTNSLPRSFKPEKGYVVTANQPAIPSDYPHFISSDWDSDAEGFRALRITDLVLGEEGTQQQSSSSSPPPFSQQQQHTAESQSRIQLDYTSLAARELGRIVAARGLPQTPAGSALRDTLRSWDGSMETGSNTAVYWAHLFTDSLLQLVEQGELGGREGGGVHFDVSYLLEALEGEVAACTAENLPGGPFTSCAQFMGAALDAAAAAVNEKDRWGAGGIHPASMQHPILHGSVAGCLGDRAVSHGGDHFTVNVGSWGRWAGGGSLTQKTERRVEVWWAVLIG